MVKTTAVDESPSLSHHNSNPLVDAQTCTFPLPPPPPPIPAPAGTESMRGRGTPVNQAPVTPNQRDVRATRTGEGVQHATGCKAEETAASPYGPAEALAGEAPGGTVYVDGTEGPQARWVTRTCPAAPG